MTQRTIEQLTSDIASLLADSTSGEISAADVRTIAQNTIDSVIFLGGVSITLGTVTTGAPGSSVIITNTGTSEAPIFNFTIPAGSTGATGADGAQGAPGQSISGVITEASTARSLSSSDANQFIACTNAGTVTITADQLTQGDVVYVRQQGAGQVTIAAGSGVTITPSGGLGSSTRVQNSVIALIYQSATEVVLIGDLSSV